MLPVVAKGALIGGGVGAVLAAVRTPVEGQGDPGRAGRVLKSAAEGALAGAVVGFFLDRSLRQKAAELLATAPVVVDAVAELAHRYEPAVERFAETARDRAVGAYEQARPRVIEAYEQARPRVIEAYEQARPRVEEAVDVVRAKALELRAS